MPARVGFAEMKLKGIVYLVGAGPGDAGLLTLRGADLLRRAEVVIYDALVNPELLRLTTAGVELVFGGKHAKEHALTQDQINDLLINKAREGKIVVRLKGGDPTVFGRAGEEAEALATARVPFEIVPGVSSFVAAPTYAGIPVTHRDHSSKLSIITGHEDPTKPEATVDWGQVAKEPGTKVVMMATARIGQIAAKLIAGGMKSTTPVAMISSGTTGRQRTVIGSLKTIGADTTAADLQPPSLAVIGDVVQLAPKLNWFEKRPLFRQRIVVTRSREQAAEFVSALHDLGADVLTLPVIKIAPPTNKDSLKDVLLEVGTYDWLVFTSANGVNEYFRYFLAGFEDLRAIGNVRIAAVGPGTAARLKELHLRVDVMPEEALGVKIAKAMNKFEDIENLKVCLLRAEDANPDLPAALNELGAIVDDIAVYKTVAETEDITGAGVRLLEEGADWVTFTSGSSVEKFHERFDLRKLVAKFPQLKLATIGPETTKTVAALGLKPTVEAKPHTTEGLLKALVARASRP
jgi:uroporphyrinogen III methyltransferase / synthase